MELISTRELRDYGMLGMNARNLDFIGRYNARSRYPLVDNKLKTKLLAEEYGIPVPQLRFSLTQQHDVEEAIEKLDEPPRGSDNILQSNRLRRTRT